MNKIETEFIQNKPKNFKERVFFATNVQNNPLSHPYPSSRKLEQFASDNIICFSAPCWLPYALWLPLPPLPSVDHLSSPIPQPQIQNLSFDSKDKKNRIETNLNRV